MLITLATPSWFRFRVLARVLIVVTILAGSLAGVVSMLHALLPSTLTSLAPLLLAYVSLIGRVWFIASFLSFGRPLGLSLILDS